MNFITFTTSFLQHVLTGRVWGCVADDLALFSLPEAFDAAYGADAYDEVITLIICFILRCESSARGGGSRLIIAMCLMYDPLVVHRIIHETCAHTLLVLINCDEGHSSFLLNLHCVY